MQQLTRQHVIDQLSATEQGAQDSHQLAAWAFDQFYAEEAGSVVYEPGYRRAISSVLDDVMFSDQPGFHLSSAELQQMMQHLAQAQPVPDDEDEDEDEDDQDMSSDD